MFNFNSDTSQSHWHSLWFFAGFSCFTSTVLLLRCACPLAFFPSIIIPAPLARCLFQLSVSFRWMPPVDCWSSTVACVNLCACVCGRTTSASTFCVVRLTCHQTEVCELKWSWNAMYFIHLLFGPCIPLGFLGTIFSKSSVPWFGCRYCCGRNC